MTHRRIGFAFVAILLVASTASADTQLIHAGTLLAVPGERPARNQTVVVADGRIAEIRNGFADASEFEGEVHVIDLRDAFVPPGLMDMHVHLQFELGPENDSETLKMSPQQIQMRSILHAMRTLEAGFTTVRDVGNSGQEMYALRDGIDNG
jgi:imidazolonepropionase-like amidohydrolase